MPGVANCRGKGEGETWGGCCVDTEAEEGHAGDLGGHVVCQKEVTSMDFPCGPVVKTLRVHCMGKGLILHAMA